MVPILLHARFNQIILMEPHNVYEIEKGLGFVWEVLPDGREALADLAQQGTATECSGARNAVYELRVKAAARIRIHAWAPLQQHPEQMARLFAKLRGHSMRALQLAMIGRHKYVRDRLELLLVFLSEQFGVPFPDNRRLIPFALTHEEMANAVNSTRSTITRLMSGLEREGAISHLQRGRQRLIVLPAAWTAEAGEVRRLAGPL